SRSSENRTRGDVLPHRFSKRPSREGIFAIRASPTRSREEISLRPASKRPLERAFCEPGLRNVLSRGHFAPAFSKRASRESLRPRASRRSGSRKRIAAVGIAKPFRRGHETEVPSPPELR